MLLTHIDIVNFKNIEEAQLDFSEGVNCLVGRNGMGKSNLLEAIHMLCMARTTQPLPEQSLLRHGTESMLIKGEFVSDSGTSDKVSCGITADKGKSLRINGKEYSKISDHIGRFPVVTVSPSDSRIITDGAEERRRLIDMVLSQSDSAYLSELIRYRRALDSRNRMLRSGFRDALLFESVESSLCQSAEAIHRFRASWIEAISTKLVSYYEEISDGNDGPAISYSSQLDSKSMEQLLAEHREKDRVLGYTSAGPHRDDILTRLGHFNLRRQGSQGQIKTFAIALRLTIFEFLKGASGITPILLLDDIFDKLDSQRVGRIMKLVSQASDFRQIFITDTNREHIDEILSSISGPHMLLKVEDGRFTPHRP